jgi:Fe-S-cluster containining protein
MAKKLDLSNNTKDTMATDKVNEEQEDYVPWFHEGLNFKCTGCGKCCSGSPGYVYLSLSDVERLANHFQISEKEFLQKYTRFIDGTYALLDRMGTEDCLFLKDNKCSVYEARPSQCKTFPWWISNLREPKDWKEAGLKCEGINHPDAEKVDGLKIQHELLTYVDNLSDMHIDI